MQGSRAFVYGTLMADEVLKLLLKRVPDNKPATLAGYRRHSIRGQVFPAIVPADASATVRGKVLLQLTDKELEILDVYEAEEYYRARVEPKLDDGTAVEANVYVWRDAYRHLLDGEWDYDAWRANHFAAWMDRSEDQLLPEEWDYGLFRSRDLADYLGMTTEFMAEYFAQPEDATGPAQG